MKERGIVLVSSDRILAAAVCHAARRHGLSADAVPRDAAADSQWGVGDVVVVDVGRGESGLAFIEALADCDPRPRLVVMSDQRNDAILLAAVNAGADGYVTKDEGVDEVLNALRTVASGNAAIPGDMLATLLREMINRRREDAIAIQRIARLSAREKVVLRLLVEGLDREAIAARLFVSPHTARSHVQSVLTKLEVNSTLEAVAVVGDLDLLRGETLQVES